MFSADESVKKQITDSKSENLTDTDLESTEKQIFAVLTNGLLIYTEKTILLVFMQQNSFVVSTKHFAISIKFWLLKQNILLGQ